MNAGFDRHMSLYYGWAILLRDAEEWLTTALNSRHRSQSKGQAVATLNASNESTCFRRAEAALNVLHCSMER